MAAQTSQEDERVKELEDALWDVVERAEQIMDSDQPSVAVHEIAVAARLVLGSAKEDGVGSKTFRASPQPEAGADSE